ncbi:MAG: hypothetical protein K2N65_05420, partial [Anaeroplasmataceae bacterium]|nr:hypothetical protein [Anaeroplasmataceae bacterium]
MAKEELSLTDCLNCSTEEEVKNIFSKVFNFALMTSDQIDAYTEYCLFEFKYDRSFDSIYNRAK